MSLLNNIVEYWLDCIKHEDVLGKDISINVRTKAVLYPFDRDLFVFSRTDDGIRVDGETLHNIIKRSGIQNEELYYGYPLLFYYEEREEKYSVAPLFILKVSYREKDGRIFLHRDEALPSCGIQAMTKIGLRTEEIAVINQEFEKIFNSQVPDAKAIAQECLNVLLEETKFLIREEIDPNKLTNTQRLSRKMSPGVYNKSVIFTGDNTLYNMSLINDLLKLKGRNDIDKTSLGFLLSGQENGNQSSESKSKNSFNKPIILPYPLNEYQTTSLRNVFENKVSIITGPPGTGKSQFIMNLLINIFLNDKTALFVSHTNEAVDIVNEKVNKDFQNILFRTGKKEHRQDLIRKFNELFLDSQKSRGTGSPSENRIKRLWNKIVDYKKVLLRIDELEEKTNELLEQKQLKKGLLLLIKTKYYIRKLNRMPSRIEVEKQIRKNEGDYYLLSEKYVRDIYIKKMLSKWGSANKAKKFLHEIQSTKFNEEVGEYSAINALDVLRIWSSTLKSLSRTFGLKANMFDYVIFDEASQIDLPSAAPALYRAKNVIVVGDPMQLSHIAGITKDIDKQIAKAHNLADRPDLYPAKIRYYDVSLYCCAELCSGKPPILLAKHYRSHDQIINLCNEVFYSDRLSVCSRLNFANWPETMPLGVHWKNCEGVSLMPPGGSRANREEVAEVNNLFKEILKKVKGTDLSIGIVTPYSRQQNEIHNKITQDTSAETIAKHNVKILTAHKFQGSEKDVVIFSLVLANRGNGNNDRWYNAHPQILNVALSRARYLLYIVGDKQFCCTRRGILRKIADTYDHMKEEETFEEQYFAGKFDTPAERYLYEKLQKIDFQSIGYRLVPKRIVGRYTLDFALMGKRKIDIECDGFSNHHIIDGLPVIEDVERDLYLEEQEWEVLRFPNHQIYSKADFVIQTILQKL